MKCLNESPLAYFFFFFCKSINKVEINIPFNKSLSQNNEYEIPTGLWKVSTSQLTLSCVDEHDEEENSGTGAFAGERRSRVNVLPSAGRSIETSWRCKLIHNARAAYDAENGFSFQDGQGEFKRSWVVLFFCFVPLSQRRTERLETDKGSEREQPSADGHLLFV